MPIYDYRCADCGTRFEQLVRGEQQAACPSCSGHKLDRLMSLPARRTSAGTQPEHSRVGPPASGGCCGGGCGSHSH